MGGDSTPPRYPATGQVINSFWASHYISRQMAKNSSRMNYYNPYTGAVKLTNPYFTYQFLSYSLKSGAKSRENSGREKQDKLVNNRQKSYFDLARRPVSSFI